jgi:hypothetical protein
MAKTKDTGVVITPPNFKAVDFHIHGIAPYVQLRFKVYSKVLTIKQAIISYMKEYVEEENN